MYPRMLETYLNMLLSISIPSSGRNLPNRLVLWGLEHLETRKPRMLVVNPITWPLAQILLVITPCNFPERDMTCTCFLGIETSRTSCWRWFEITWTILNSFFHIWGTRYQEFPGSTWPGQSTPGKCYCSYHCFKQRSLDPCEAWRCHEGIQRVLWCVCVYLSACVCVGRLG